MKAPTCHISVEFCGTKRYLNNQWEKEKYQKDPTRTRVNTSKLTEARENASNKLASDVSYESTRFLDQSLSEVNPNQFYIGLLSIFNWEFLCNMPGKVLSDDSNIKYVMLTFKVFSLS